MAVPEVLTLQQCFLLTGLRLKDRHFDSSTQSTQSTPERLTNASSLFASSRLLGKSFWWKLALDRGTPQHSLADCFLIWAIQHQCKQTWIQRLMAIPFFPVFSRLTKSWNQFCIRRTREKHHRKRPPILQLGLLFAGFMEVEHSPGASLGDSSTAQVMPK